MLPEFCVDVALLQVMDTNNEGTGEKIARSAVIVPENEDAYIDEDLAKIGENLECHIEWSDEDQVYVATSSLYPGLSWLGKSEFEALKGFLKMAIEDTQNRNGKDEDKKAAPGHEGASNTNVPSNENTTTGDEVRPKSDQSEGSSDIIFLDGDTVKTDEDKTRLIVCRHEAAHALVAINLGGDLASINVTPVRSETSRKMIMGQTTYLTYGVGKVTGPLKRRPSTIPEWNWAMAMSSFAGDAYSFWCNEDCSAKNLGSHLDHLLNNTIDGKSAIRYLMNTTDDVTIDDYLKLYGEDGWWILIDAYRDALDMTVRYNNELKMLTAYLNTYAGEDGEANAAGFAALNTAITAGNIAIGTVAGAADLVGTIAGGAIKVAGGIGSLIGHFVK